MAAACHPVLKAYVDPRLSRIAEAWVGFPVEVRCFPSDTWRLVVAERDAWYGDWPDQTTIGFAESDADRIWFDSRICGQLATLDARSGVPDPELDPSLDLADAIANLSHEIAHIDDPDGDEAETECAAVQRAAWTAMQLGASAQEARSLAERYWRLSYPENFAEYRTDECRNGGELDEHPNTSRWP